MLHEKDYARIRYARICTEEEKEVPYEEIVKGYEYEKGNYVILTEDDFTKANVKKTKSIAILDFAKEDEVPSEYFNKPYILGPDGADQTYALFRDALSRTKRVGIGKFVLRNREHLVEIRPQDEAIIMIQLRYSSEIRDFHSLTLPREKNYSDREIEMAIMLIDQLSRPLQIEAYKDTYNEELYRIIDEKKKGITPHAKGTLPKATKVPDLVKVLQASLDKAKK